MATIAGNSEEEAGFENWECFGARLHGPDGFTVDRGGNIVLADYCNNGLRKVSKAGAMWPATGRHLHLSLSLRGPLHRLDRALLMSQIHV